MQGRPSVPLQPAVAQAVLGPVAPEFTVTSVLPRAGGEVNAVYEVRGAGAVRPLIVKVYADRWRPKLVKEVFVYRFLASHGIRSVPQILRAEPAGVPALPAAFTVMTMLDGQPLSAVGDQLADSDVDRVYEQAGRLLAAIHRIVDERWRWGYVTTRIVDWKPTNAAYMADQFAVRLRRFAELGGDPSLAAAIERHVSRHADVFAACRAPVLCHNDFHDGNVLVSRVGPGWQVSGCVDVEGAIVADPLLDLAKTDYYALRDDPAKRRAFIRGYGPLPPDWPDRVAIYHLHHALEYWNWSASTGKRASLPGITADIEKIIGAPGHRP